METEVAGALGDASALMPTTGLLAAIAVFMVAGCAAGLVRLVQRGFLWTMRRGFLCL